MERENAAVECPVCATAVPLDRRTMGDQIECPSCHAGFRIQLARAGGTFSTSVETAGPPPEPTAALKEKIEIRGVLGRGGQGTVYRVRPKGTQRDFALKFLDSAAAAPKGAGPQDLSSELNHPNIVGVFATGIDGGRRYALYEIVEGRTLSSLIAEGPVKIDTLLDIAFQMAAALAHSHAHGIVHRDLKPDNVLLTTQGQTKIADFGIGRWIGTKNTIDTEASEGFIGTPGYAAPEQIAGWGVIRASDVYAFGMTLYEMSTGRLPFRAPSLEVLLHHQVNTEPPPPESFRADLPPALSQLIMDCLRKSPASRPQTMERVHERLESISFALGAAVPLPVEPTPLEPRLPGSAAVQAQLRVRAAWLAGALALFALMPLAHLARLSLIGHAVKMDLVLLVLMFLLGRRVARDTERGPVEWISTVLGQDHDTAWRMTFGFGVFVCLGLVAEANSDAELSPASAGVGMVRIGLAHLLATGAVRWLLDAGLSDVKDMEARGQGWIECTGNPGITVRLDGAPAVAVPCLQRVRLGRHELVFEAEKRQSRYSVHVSTPSHAAVAATLQPEGPRAQPGEGAGSAALKPLYGLIAGIVIGALIAAGSVVGLLRMTGLSRRLEVRPPPPPQTKFETILAEWTPIVEQQRARLRQDGEVAWPLLAEALAKTGKGETARTELVAHIREHEITAPIAAALANALEGFHRLESGGAYQLAIQLDPKVTGIPAEATSRAVDRDDGLRALGWWLSWKGLHQQGWKILEPYCPDLKCESSARAAALLCGLGRKDEGCAMLKGRNEGDSPDAEKVCGCGP